MSFQMAWIAFPVSSIALLTALTSLLVLDVSSAMRSMASMITQRARSPVPLARVLRLVVPIVDVEVLPAAMVCCRPMAAASRCYQ